ncbi:MAG: hypothetical protein JXJ04_25045, partial [Spirochaetales bacterium]|nr:hypothetical protein [Spirochaetales bacterium]
RESVHVYMPGDLYRRFKLMHQDLNVYSMAQLVRFFLGWFLDFIRVYGEVALAELDVIMKQYKEKNKRKSISTKQIRQLLQFIYKNTVNNCLLNIYNHKFSPQRILRL